MALDLKNKLHSPGQITQSVWNEDTNRIRAEVNGSNLISYEEITDISPDILTTIITETLLISKRLTCIHVSGDNLAEYTFNVNGLTKLKTRTNVTNLNYVFETNDLELNAGDVIEIKVIHHRLDNADFNASLFYKS